METNNFSDTTFTGQMTQAMNRMHSKAMSLSMTGNADKDFALMMAVHHEGSIEMAELYLKKGKSKRLREMAGKSIKDQQRETEQLRQWLQRH